MEEKISNRRRPRGFGSFFLPFWESFERKTGLSRVSVFCRRRRAKDGADFLVFFLLPPRA
jgi:hypothetical protein